MEPLSVASIDPGGTTGIAVVRVSTSPKKLWVRQITIQSLTETKDVIQVIQRHRPDSIIMERRAAAGNSEGLVPYEKILNGISDLNYTQWPNDTDIVYLKHNIILINPGTWKPFMKRASEDPKLWNCGWDLTTQHEKDAVMLLHYALFFHLQPIREVVYE